MGYASIFFSVIPYDFRYGFGNGFAPFRFLTPFPKPLLITEIKMLPWDILFDSFD
jgi:hypothetical protein